jgi:quercetin dioxygenase-like cupin family protein
MVKITLQEAEYIPRLYGKLHLVSPRGVLRNLQVLHMVIAPGGKTSKHYHPSEEIFFIVHGKAVFVGAELTIELREGEAVIVAPGEPHKIENMSDTDECEVLIALSPPRQPSEV